MIRPRRNKLRAVALLLAIMIGAVCGGTPAPPPTDPTYTLTVTNGSGGGSYEEGEEVVIMAPEHSPHCYPHETFKWVVTEGSAVIDDLFSRETTLTMPAGPVTVMGSCLYLTTYTLSVEGGDGGGKYPAGKVVDITADACPEGEEFDEWVVTSGNPTIDNAKDPMTTLTMPDERVIVTRSCVTTPSPFPSASPAPSAGPTPAPVPEPPSASPSGTPSASPSASPSSTPTVTPPGSCCIDGGCVIVDDEDGCKYLNGTYRGDRTTCPNADLFTQPCDYKSSDGPCPPGQGCIIDTCKGPMCTIACAGEDQVCCQGMDVCNDDGCSCVCSAGLTYSIASKTCVPCSDVDQPCCDGDKCASGKVCQPATKTCAECGSHGDPCCSRKVKKATDCGYSKHDQCYSKYDRCYSKDYDDEVDDDSFGSSSSGKGGSKGGGGKGSSKGGGKGGSKGFDDQDDDEYETIYECHDGHVCQAGHTCARCGAEKGDPCCPPEAEGGNPTCGEGLECSAGLLCRVIAPPPVVTPLPSSTPSGWPSSIPSTVPTSAPITAPTKAPTKAPTTEPTPALPCIVVVEVDCVLSNGIPCKDAVSPNPTCAIGDGIDLVSFTYDPDSDCSDSDNSQGAEAACADINPLVDGTVAISCLELSGNPLSVEPPLVSPGERVVVTSPSGSELPAKINCNIASSAGVELQQNLIDVSGDVQLDLKDQFGALVLESCDDQTCIETLCYDITISNIGTDEMDITDLEFTFNGETEDLLSQIPVNPLPVGQSTSVEKKRQVDICTVVEYCAQVDVEANPPNGQMCQDDDEYKFEIPTPQPTSIPTPSPTRRRYLTARRELIGVSTKEEVAVFFNKRSGWNPNGKFIEKDEMLSIQECELLKSYILSNLAAGDKDQEAFESKDFHLTAQTLVDLLGKDKVMDLLEFIYEAAGERALVKDILMRRTKNDGSLGNYVDFHTNEENAGYKQSTLVVALNNDDDVTEGGELFYLHSGGAYEAHRTQGKAFAHAYDVVHGVGPHRGSRISIYINLDHEPSPGTKNLLEGTDLMDDDE